MIAAHFDRMRDVILTIFENLIALENLSHAGANMISRHFLASSTYYVTRSPQGTHTQHRTYVSQTRSAKPMCFWFPCVLLQLLVNLACIMICLDSGVSTVLGVLTNQTGRRHSACVARGTRQHCTLVHHQSINAKVSWPMLNTLKDLK